MITDQGLFLFCDVVVSIISLVVLITSLKL